MPREPILIDTEAFVRRGGHLEGELAVTELERLAAEVASADGRFRFDLDGRMDGGKRLLILAVRGRLTLTCQRCLGAMDFPLEIDAVFRLVREGEDWPEDELEDDRVDAVPEERELDALKFVEDEVLLALPVSPRHRHCESPRRPEDAKRASPFAALGSLKRGNAAH